jgi:glycosyltransferase involved in cell wall biosynthesis
MPFRIAHLNLARGYRGGERQTELLIRGLAKHGLEQFLVCRRGEPLAARLNDVGGLRTLTAGGGLVTASLSIPAADIMHAHEGRCIYAAWLRHAVTGVPYIITRRVPNPVSANWLTRRAYRQAARVVGISDDICARLIAYEPSLRVQKISSVASQLPVDPDVVKRLKQDYGGEFVVGHVGALDNDHKGQAHIIAVARRLADSHPGIHFLLVGGGPDEAMLRSMAHGLHNVHFTGFVSNVGDYLAMFDIFVLPSNREGLGSILLDAMQSGLPVIASRTGGIPELVHEGENGLLLAPGDVRGFEAAVLRLYDAPDERARLGARSRTLAADFTPAAMARQYLALYESILERERA